MLSFAVSKHQNTESNSLWRCGQKSDQERMQWENREIVGMDNWQKFSVVDGEERGDAGARNRVNRGFCFCFCFFMVEIAVWW